MKFSELVSELRSAGVPEAECEAEIIFRELFGISRRDVLLSSPEVDSASAMEVVGRRRLHEPLMYIIGYSYFYREKYRVTPAVLIPRQDTEILVEYATAHIPAGENILDLCSGSGCVGISTLKNSAASEATLVDISSEAVALSLKNAEYNGVGERVSAICADVLNTLPGGKYFAILSNPPYVSEAAYSSLAGEIYFEPKGAFLGGVDGLDFYRSLIPRLGEVMKPGGFIAFEIGYDEAEALRSLASENGYSCEILLDLSKNPRVAVLRRED